MPAIAAVPNGAGAKFRQDVLQSSSELRRNTPQDHGMTRSIVDILFDRQARGMRAIYIPPSFSSLTPTNTATPGNQDGSNTSNGVECPSCNGAVDSVLWSSSSSKQEDPNHNDNDNDSRRNGRSSSPSTVFDADVTLSATTSSNANAQSANNTTITTTGQPPPPPPPSSEPTTRTAAVAAKDEDDEVDERNAPSSLFLYREIGPCRVSSELLYYVEYLSSVQYHSSFLTHLGGDDRRDAQGQRPGSSRAVSTISIAFSPDGQTMASTHGDHSVKISSCVTGQLLQSLDGHPRTPWTVKYHPFHSHILASGCLGHQVRIWDWPSASCLHMVRLEYAIISVAFHPSGQVLAIANGTRLHFWGVPLPPAQQLNNNNNSNHNHNNTRNHHRTTAPAVDPPVGYTTLTEMDQRHMLRCVHFPPDGKTLIIGGVNPQSVTTAATANDRRTNNNNNNSRNSNAGVTFYLRLWDFHLAHAVTPPPRRMPTTSSLQQQQQPPPPRPRPISNPRVFIPRALLYNDGGFDVSPDGTMLCACVEYWLPDGVDNAMELVHQEEVLYQQRCQMEEDEFELLQQQRRNQQQQHQQQFLSFGSLHLDNVGSFHNPTSTSTSSSVVTPRSFLFRSSTSSTTTPDHHPNSHPYPEVAPRTPEPNMSSSALLLSPPPPPGRRFMPTPTGGGGETTTTTTNNNNSSATTTAAVSTTATNSTSLLFGQQPPQSQQQQQQQQPRTHSFGTTNLNSSQQSQPQQPQHQQAHHHHPSSSSSHIAAAVAAANYRPPHPLSTITSSTFPMETRQGGRYVPHVVTISLDTTPLEDAILERIPGPHQQQLQQLQQQQQLQRNHGSSLSSSNNNNNNNNTHDSSSSSTTSAFTAVSSASSMSTTTTTMTTNHRGGGGGGSTITTPLLPAVAVGYRPRLGQLFDACPLEVGKATAVTCVKFSPSQNFCLIGYGVREAGGSGNSNTTAGGTGGDSSSSLYHPVTSIYRLRSHYDPDNRGRRRRRRGRQSSPVCRTCRRRRRPLPPVSSSSSSSEPAESHTHGTNSDHPNNDNHHHDHNDINNNRNNMCQISTMLSQEDDVNIARFHPDPGHGFVYGTKQGRVRVVSTRPWMFYHDPPPPSSPDGNDS